MERGVLTLGRPREPEEDDVLWPLPLRSLSMSLWQVMLILDSALPEEMVSQTWVGLTTFSSEDLLESLSTIWAEG